MSRYCFSDVIYSNRQEAKIRPEMVKFLLAEERPLKLRILAVFLVTTGDADFIAVVYKDRQSKQIQHNLDRNKKRKKTFRNVEHQVTDTTHQIMSLSYDICPLNRHQHTNA